jgi:hypothetical protein
MLAKPIAKKRVENLLVMKASVNTPRDYSQRISNEQLIFYTEKAVNDSNFAPQQR